MKVVIPFDGLAYLGTLFRMEAENPHRTRYQRRLFKQLGRQFDVRAQWIDLNHDELDFLEGCCNAIGDMLREFIADARSGVLNLPGNGEEVGHASVRLQVIERVKEVAVAARKANPRKS